MLKSVSPTIYDELQTARQNIHMIPHLQQEERLDALKEILAKISAHFEAQEIKATSFARIIFDIVKDVFVEDSHHQKNAALLLIDFCQDAYQKKCIGAFDAADTMCNASYFFKDDYALRGKVCEGVISFTEGKYSSGEININDATKIIFDITRDVLSGSSDEKEFGIASLAGIYRQAVSNGNPDISSQPRLMMMLDRNQHRVSAPLFGGRPAAPAVTG